MSLFLQLPHSHLFLDGICGLAGILIANRTLSSRFSSDKSEGTISKTGGDRETTVVFERGRLGIQMKSEFGPSVVIVICPDVFVRQ